MAEIPRKRTFEERIAGRRKVPGEHRSCLAFPLSTSFRTPQVAAGAVGFSLATSDGGVAVGDPMLHLPTEWSRMSKKSRHRRERLKATQDRPQTNRASRSVVDLLERG